MRACVRACVCVCVRAKGEHVTVSIYYHIQCKRDTDKGVNM